MKKLTLAFILSVTAFLQGYAQVDSFTVYSNRIKDTASLTRLINYSFKQKERQPDSAFKYSKIALDYSRKLKSPFCEARSLTNLGAISYAQGNYAEALSYHTEGLKIWESLNYYEGIATNKNNISDVYTRLKNPVMAERYLKEAEDIALKHQLTKQLGLIKINLGNFYFSQSKFRQAIASFQESISINTKYSALKLVGTAYSNAGGCLFMLGKIDSAIIFYRKAIETSSRAADRTQNVYNYSNLGEALAAKGQLKEAIEYYNRAGTDAEALGLKDMLTDVYSHLADLSKSQQDYKAALRFTGLKDSVARLVMNAQVAQQITEVQTKYDTAKKEQLIKDQQRDLLFRTVLFIAALIILTLVLLLVFYRNKRVKAAQDARLQMEIMHQQEMAAKGVIAAEERERKRIAADLHDGVGQLMSAVRLNLATLFDDLPADAENAVLAEKTIALVDESCREVRTMAHQMMPNILIKTGLASAVKDFVTKIDEKRLKVTWKHRV